MFDSIESAVRSAECVVRILMTWHTECWAGMDSDFFGSRVPLATAVIINIGPWRMIIIRISKSEKVQNVWVMADPEKFEWW